MKRKLIVSILSLLVIFSTTGCKNDNQLNNKIKTNSSSVVIFFSATGTTRKIAKKLAKNSNSDIIEIIPKEEYKTEDLNYNSDCRANREQEDSGARPEIKNKIDINKYNIVYLGYPIWWGTNPKIILTLLDTYDFTNKIIIPFCTSGSSEIDNSITDLRNYNPNLNIKDGKRFSSNSNDKEIINFINNQIEESSDMGSEVMNSIKITINEEEYIMELENNETVRELINVLPKELEMNELNGNEKYVYLDNTFKTNPSNPKKINIGDVMLYGNNCLVIFYQSFNTSYSYTKIGHINNLPNLGNGNVKVKIERK